MASDSPTRSDSYPTTDHVDIDPDALPDLDYLVPEADDTATAATAIPVDAPANPPIGLFTVTPTAVPSNVTASTGGTLKRRRGGSPGETSPEKRSRNVAADIANRIRNSSNQASGPARPILDIFGTIGSQPSAQAPASTPFSSLAPSQQNPFALGSAYTQPSGLASAQSAWKHLGTGPASGEFDLFAGDTDFGANLPPVGTYSLTNAAQSQGFQTSASQSSGNNVGLSYNPLNEGIRRMRHRNPFADPYEEQDNTGPTGYSPTVYGALAPVTPSPQVPSRRSSATGIQGTPRRTSQHTRLPTPSAAPSPATVPAPTTNEIDRNHKPNGDLSWEVLQTVTKDPARATAVRSIMTSHDAGEMIDRYWVKDERSRQQVLHRGWKTLFKVDNSGRKPVLDNAPYLVQFAYTTTKSREETIALNSKAATSRAVQASTPSTVMDQGSLDTFFSDPVGDEEDEDGQSEDDDGNGRHDEDDDNDDDEETYQPPNERKVSTRRKARPKGGARQPGVRQNQFFQWPETRILMWICEFDDDQPFKHIGTGDPTAKDEHGADRPNPGDLPEVAAGGDFHQLQSVATPVVVNLALLGDLEITAEEFFTFFPLHTAWRDPMYKYNRNKWTQTRAVEMIYWTRQSSLTDTRAILRKAVEKQIEQATEFVLGFRYTKDRRRPKDLPPIDNYRLGQMCDERGCRGPNAELLNDYLLLNCADGVDVAQWPTGLGEGAFTRALRHAKTNNNNPALSELHQYLATHNISTVMPKPPNGANADVAAMDRHRNAMHQYALQINLPT